MAKAKSGWRPDRSILFRPERLSYVRRKGNDAECVFCRAFEDQSADQSLVLGQLGTAVAILNKFPYNSGHVLVLPHRHTGDLESLSRKEVLDLQLLLQKAIKATQEEYGPDGFNIGLNLGKAAGAGLPQHLHWHLIPRWSGDVNFFPLIARTKVVVETLDQMAERLRPYFSSRQRTKR